uniref:Uncharacterized protein n=1 Tax=Onchocerca volvulus TaxID=6282 RepID=A0A8R1XTC7_ONCVO
MTSGGKMVINWSLHAQLIITDIAFGAFRPDVPFS